MKEEVEGEYAERMEGLREIYRFVKWFPFFDQIYDGKVKCMLKEDKIKSQLWK